MTSRSVKKWYVIGYFFSTMPFNGRFLQPRENLESHGRKTDCSSQMNLALCPWDWLKLSRCKTYQSICQEQLIRSNETKTMRTLWKKLKSTARVSILLAILLFYYSTIASFYLIWSRELAKYETVIHCSVSVWPVLEQSEYGRNGSFSMKEIAFIAIQSLRI